MKIKTGMVWACFLGLSLLFGVARAQSVPQLINYQGRLAGSAGLPVADGTTIDMTFAFYRVASGGTADLTVLQEGVVVRGGIYDVLIGSGIVVPGSVSTLDEVFGQYGNVWMEVGVEGQALSPRTRISSVGYAFRSQLADTVAAGAIGTSQLANTAVTTAQLSTAGGLFGQVLKISGGGVAWSDDSLSMPFAGSVADSGAAFSVENTGTGLAGRFVGDVEVDGRLDVQGTGIYAPVFYDADSYTYYLDPDGTSHLNNMQCAVMYDANDVTYYLDPNGTTRLNILDVATINSTTFDTRYLRKDLTVAATQSIRGDLDVRTDSQSYLHPNCTNSTNWTCIGAQVLTSQYYYGASSSDNIYIGESNPVSIPGYLSTPIVYDFNNTSYYLDPASVSILNNVRANIFYDAGDTSFYLDPAGISILNDVRGDRFYSRQNTSYYLDPDGTSHLNNMQCAVMYDSDDVSYYVDPNGTTKLNILDVTTINSTAFDTRYLRKDLTAVATQTMEGDLKVGSIGILHPNCTNANNWNCIGGQVFTSQYYYGTSSSGSITIGETNPVSVPGSMTTPIVYDYNNTAYYVDPSSASMLNDVRANVYYDLSDTSYYLDPASVSVLNDVRGDRFASRQNTSYYLDPDGNSYLNTLRATIVYDADNTAYYVDPASVSILNDIRPRILYDGDDNSYYLDPSATTILNQLRAGAFTDKDDTGYSVDPNASSIVNNLQVSGNFTRPAGIPSLPIAYAHIASTGGKTSGTTNVSGVWNTTNLNYEITITGESYSYTTYVTTVTPDGSTPYIATINSMSGKLVVTIFNLSGARIQTGFSFTTFKP